MSTEAASRNQQQPPPLELGEKREPLIAIRDLKVHFDLGGGTAIDNLLGGSAVHKVVKAVDGVTLDIYPGETLGLVGESGCGKSTLGRAILRLTEPTSGQVLYQGQDLAHLSEGEMREQRKNLQMIFQDPYASLNPRMTVGQIIGEPIETFHSDLSAEQSPTWLKALGAVAGVAAGGYLGFKYLMRYSVPYFNSLHESIGGWVGWLVGGLVFLIITAIGLLISLALGYLVYHLIVRKTLRIGMALLLGAVGWFGAGAINKYLESRGKEIAEDLTILRVFLSSLLFVVGWLLAYKIKPSLRTFGGKIDQEVQNLMETVGLSKRFLRRYPHEFSGGQRQRIGIARALAVDPDFIVADEPISALDVSIQAQIMNLMEKLQRAKNLTYLFISHDLRAIRHVSDRVAVMYLGKLVEVADAKVIYDEPLMPYTKALISAVPVPDPAVEAARRRIVLEGDVPSPINPPSGCRFHTRCPYAIEACKEVVPPLAEIKPNHFAACIRISPEEPYIEKVAPGDAPGLRDAQRVIAT
ncbi:MAG TPA: oligopeptide/dipeptide ABC transporter ATP-binding protein [Pyrinomonadaceae bacterium]|nr:oligopeptide/dipeptide ABC transporter ATP-binding protein [Pyrinomonadaceae bacterium]